MDVKGILRREAQLNLIAYIIILALVACVAILLFIVFTGISPTALFPLSDSLSRTLIFGLLLATILYLADQHRRLRRALVQTHAELEEARHRIESAYSRLAFAHHASERITSLARSDGLAVVLAESVDHFDADAAAVVGDDVTFTARNDIDEEIARDRVLAVALEAVRAGKPLSISPPGEEGAAIAVPLRACGKLQAVACLWRAHGAFEDDQLDGLSMLGRIIELSIENRMLLDQTNAQLEGTIEALGSLVEDIRPNYTCHATAVGNLSALIGEQLGQSPSQQRELRVAGQLHDVGMLRLGRVGSPLEALSPSDLVRIKSHPSKGAELAQMAHFTPYVQDAILSHHERLNGSGYPRGLSGSAVAMSARILGVTEVYDSMTRRIYGGPSVEADSALEELRAHAGVLFDARVVEALAVVLKSYTEEQADVAPEPVAPTIEYRMPESTGSPTPEWTPSLIHMAQSVAPIQTPRGTSLPW